MTGARHSPLVRFTAFALLAIVAPAVILATIGYHSLRQWRHSADELFREQSRSMAVMVADKVDLALRNVEYPRDGAPGLPASGPLADLAAKRTPGSTSRRGPATASWAGACSPRPRDHRDG